MTVFTDSRYANSIIIEVTDTRNDADVDRDFMYEYDSLDENVPIRDVYTVSQGDRLDRITASFGEDSDKWWVIAEVNGIFGFPLFLTPGMRLKIPTTDVFKQISRGSL